MYFCVRIASKYMPLSHSAQLWRLPLVASKLWFEVKLNYLRLITLTKPRKAGVMSYQGIKEYLAAIVDGYKKSSKAKKTEILNEANRITKLTREHLGRRLRSTKESILRRKPSGRPKKFARDLLMPHIQYLWIQMERVSAKRMKANYPDWLPFYKADGFTTEVRLQLERMSTSTLERFLREIRKNQAVTKGLATTKCPARYMKNKVPINTLDAKIDRPGYFQSDTVAHCGNTTAGTYVSSITLTDIYSQWTVNRAIPSKHGHEVRKMFAELERGLGFAILGLNVDSGSEFLNTPVLKFTKNTDGKDRFVYTRSRPYKKNDNCFVEQKNFTHVRELFGYERFEDPRLVAMMNDIYRYYWNPLQNYFMTTFKLKEKTRVGARIVKKYGPPMTPYDRLIQSTHLTKEQKEKLTEQKKKLNPFTLKAELESKLELFFIEVKKLKQREAA